MWRVVLIAAAVRTVGAQEISPLLAGFSHQRQFDILSASVDNEYANKEIQFDPSQVISYEAPTLSIPKLNERNAPVLFEGDMVLSEKRLAELVEASLKDADRSEDDRGEIADVRGKRQAFLDRTYPDTIWHNGVPYEMANNLTPGAAASIRRAIQFWQDESCINFYPRRGEAQFLNFVGGDDGCWSTVGRDTSLGRQVVSIGRGCEHFGITSHELAHALGIFHEQSRYDRDRYVSLNTRVVDRSLLFNFAKVSPSELSTYGLPYDVGSVMHYAPTEFSSNRRVPALTTVDPLLQQSMGNMEGPSFVDVQSINEHYKCQRRCPRALPCQNGGYINARNCNSCKCPSGFGGQYCQTVDASFSRNCGGVIQVEEVVRRFDISIRQVGALREKKCVYHFKAPAGKRILVNVLKVGGKCIEGCYEDAAELKMSGDMRTTGYRFCCSDGVQRRIVSRGNVIALIAFTRQSGMQFTFEYTYVDERQRNDEPTFSKKAVDESPRTAITRRLSPSDGIQEEITVKKKQEKE